MASVTITMAWMEPPGPKQHSGEMQEERDCCEYGKQQWPIHNLDSQVDGINRA